MLCKDCLDRSLQGTKQSIKKSLIFCIFSKKNYYYSMNDKEQFKTKIIETDIKSSEEFFQTKKEKYKPLTKDPKKNQKEVYEKKIGDEELNKILEEIPSNTE